MTEKNGKVDLDLGDLLPQTVRVKANAKIYEMTTDITPVLGDRISRWFTAYQEALGKGEETNNSELWAIVAENLRCSEEEARALGFAGCVKVVSFLAGRLNDLTKTMWSSEPRSASRSRTAAP